MSMKVFFFEECDWVCAESLEQAITFYKKETGFDDKDIEECQPHEVSLDVQMFYSPDDLPESEKGLTESMKMFDGELFVKRSFAWVIKHDDITEPCIIASTEH